MANQNAQMELMPSRVEIEIIRELAGSGPLENQNAQIPRQRASSQLRSRDLFLMSPNRRRRIAREQRELRAELRMILQDQQLTEMLNANERLLAGQQVRRVNVVEQIFQKCTANSVEKSTEECRICMKEAEHPIGCTSCKKLVGCLSCSKKWAESSMERAEQPSCPLCRSEWKSSESVEEIIPEDK